MYSSFAYTVLLFFYLPQNNKLLLVIKICGEQTFVWFCYLVVFISVLLFWLPVLLVFCCYK